MHGGKILYKTPYLQSWLSWTFKWKGEKHSSFSLFRDEIEVDNIALCMWTLKTNGKNNAVKEKSIYLFSICGLAWNLQRLVWFPILCPSQVENWLHCHFLKLEGDCQIIMFLWKHKRNMYLKRNMKIINFSVSPCEIDGQRWHEGLEGINRLKVKWISLFHTQAMWKMWFFSSLSLII